MRPAILSLVRPVFPRLHQAPNRAHGRAHGRPRALGLALGSALAAAALAGCGGNTGGYAPSPAAYEPPAQDLTAAKDPKFRPLVQAILAQRKASKDLADFRAGFGSGGMDEAGGKKYQELFAKVADAGQKVSDLAGEANFEGEDKRVFEVIVSLSDDQLKDLLK